MIRNGQLFQLDNSGRHICENDGFLLPTPTANEAKNNPTSPSQWNRNDSLNVEMAKKMGYTLETIGKKARLNPLYVQWMMGFPIGWLD
jgi:hypothetical protein